MNGIERVDADRKLEEEINDGRFADSENNIERLLNVTNERAVVKLIVGT